LEKGKAFFIMQQKVDKKKKEFSPKCEVKIFPLAGVYYNCWVEQIFIASHSSAILSDFVANSEWA